MDAIAEQANAVASICLNPEPGAKELDENRDDKKHLEPKSSILSGMRKLGDVNETQINLCLATSINIPFSAINVSFPDSTVTESFRVSPNGEPSMNRTFRGITMEGKHVPQNAPEAIVVNSE
jgi:hypothetical protein